MRGIHKEVAECVADVVTFGLAVLHVAVTRALISARQANRDGHGARALLSNESGTNGVSEPTRAGTKKVLK